MNLTEYARHRGCYPRAVEAALAAGRIRRDERGLIDSEQADQDWQANTNPHRSAAAKRNGAEGQSMRRKLEGRDAPPTYAGVARNSIGDSPESCREAALLASSEGAKQEAAVKQPAATTDIVEYAKSRAQREHYQAELARLNYEERQGLLLRRDLIDAVATEFHRVLRDMVLAIPDRMPELSADDRTRLQGELDSLFARDCKLENLMRALHG